MPSQVSSMYCSRNRLARGPWGPLTTSVKPSPSRLAFTRHERHGVWLDFPRTPTIQWTSLPHLFTPEEMIPSYTHAATCPLKSPDGPAHAGCASRCTYVTSTTNQKSRFPSRPEWLRRRQSRPSCMDAVRRPFARNTTTNSAPYTTESCFVSSGHSARDQTIG